MPEFLLSELANRLGAVLQGDPNTVIRGIAPLADAGKQDLSFLAHARYQSQLRQTQAGVVCVRAADLPLCPPSVNALVVEDPYVAYARASRYFRNAPEPVWGVHPTAVVDPSAVLADQVSIGAYAVIGARVQIADGVVIGAHTQVGADSVLGAGTCLHGHVTLYHGVRLGERVTVHSATVIGSDGFGFAPIKQAKEGEPGWVKIEQLGGVSIGRDVEIGASCTIDRGALTDTIIEDFVILDNQIHIAHNVVVGAYTAMAACSGIAGSSVVGKHCAIGGGVGITGHIRIVDGVQIGMQSQVTGSILQPGVYGSGMGVLPVAKWRKVAARLRQLDSTVKMVHEIRARLGMGRVADEPLTEEQLIEGARSETSAMNPE